MNKSRKVIWIDIDNAPHVQIFDPIIKELLKKNDVIITAKEYGQNIVLLDLKNIPYVKIGKHPGKNPVIKIFSNIFRALQLIFFIWNKKVDLAVCHGSRALIIAAWFFVAISYYLWQSKRK